MKFPVYKLCCSKALAEEEKKDRKAKTVSSINDLVQMFLHNFHALR